MYDEMYEEEKEKREKEEMPPKWSHRDFMIELVFDMIYPEQKQAHVEMMTSKVNDQSFASAVRSVRTFSSFGTVSGEDESEWDFTSETGIVKYLSQVKVKQTTVNDF